MKWITKSAAGVMENPQIFGEKKNNQTDHTDVGFALPNNNNKKFTDPDRAKNEFALIESMWNGLQPCP